MLARYIIYIVILIEAALMSVIFLLCFLCNSVKILEYYTLVFLWQVLLHSSLAAMGL